MNLFAEISAGELIDKITILEIKLARIGDEAKRGNIARELAGLIQALEQSIGDDKEVAALRRELKTVNAELWRIEDELRAKERAQEFGALFVSLARSVYRVNDRRADLKRQVNVVTRSALVEEKSYAAY
jgi:chaperonin cofactor prefoldin